MLSNWLYSVSATVLVSWFTESKVVIVFENTGTLSVHDFAANRIYGASGHFISSWHTDSIQPKRGTNVT